MHSFIPLEVSVGRRRVRRRSSMSSISSRRRTATGRDDRPARSSAVMGLSRRACLSLSLAMSLSRDVSLSLARARAIDGASASSSPSSNASSNARTHPRTHARTHARIHSCIHSCIHASSVPTLRRRRGWISRDARRETSSRDVVARLETREREERERGERCRSPNRATEDDDGRRRRDVDSIRFDFVI